MNSQFITPTLPSDKDLANKVLDNASSMDRIKAERGLLGHIWGTPPHVAHNIAALLIFLLLISGIIYTFMKIDSSIEDRSLSIKDFWAIITPIITLAVGYLFGEKTRQGGG